MHSLLQSCQVRREAARSPLGAGCELCRKVPRGGRTRRAGSRSPVGINPCRFSCCDIFCVLASSHVIVYWRFTPFRRAVALSSPSPQSSSVDGASTQALASILNDIGASELLQNFIDDEQDDDYLLVYKKPDHISKRYGLSASTASAFISACRARAASLSAASVGSVLLSLRCGAEPAGHSPRFSRQNVVFSPYACPRLYVTP